MVCYLKNFTYQDFVTFRDCDESIGPTITISNVSPSAITQGAHITVTGTGLTSVEFWRANIGGTKAALGAALPGSTDTSAILNTDPMTQAGDYSIIAEKPFGTPVAESTQKVTVTPLTRVVTITAVAPASVPAGFMPDFDVTGTELDTVTRWFVTSGAGGFLFDPINVTPTHLTLTRGGANAIPGPGRVDAEDGIGTVLATFPITFI